MSTGSRQFLDPDIIYGKIVGDNCNKKLTSLFSILDREIAHHRKSSLYGHSILDRLLQNVDTHTLINIPKCFSRLNVEVLRFGHLTFRGQP